MATALPKGIRQRGASFVVDVTINGKRKTASFPTLEEAQFAQAKLKVALMTGEKPQAKDAGSWTLKNAYEYTLRHVWKGTRGEASAIKNMKHVLAHFGPDCLLENITTDALDDFREALEDARKANGTINRIMSALSKCLTVAVERGKLNGKPIIPRLREGRGRIRFLTYEEEDKCLALLETWGKLDQREAFIVLVDTGLRPSELWRLEGLDVDLDRSLILLWEDSTKNNLSRSVVMTSRVHAILTKRKQEYGQGRLWPMGDNFWFGRCWNRIRDHLGYQDDQHFIPYVLRHTCCSRLAQAGRPFIHIKTWMGHKSIQTTERYTHLAPQNMADLASCLERRA